MDLLYDLIGWFWLTGFHLSRRYEWLESKVYLKYFSLDGCFLSTKRMIHFVVT